MVLRGRILLFSALLLAVPATAADSTFEVLVDFEGLASFAPVGTVIGVIDMTFNDWLALIDADEPGGGGNFANEPSPSTVAFTTAINTPTVDFSSAVRQVDLYYATSSAITLTAYSGLNATGDLLGTVVGDQIGTSAASGCSGDPTGFFCKWFPLSLAAEGIQSIQVAGVANQFAIDDLKVTAGCSYAINPDSGFQGWFGGTSSVDITATAGCDWTAVSNDSWIGVTSGASGSGDGVVGYDVGRNLAGGWRQGTITIADETFTIDQNEYGCDFRVTPDSVDLGVLGGMSSVSVNMDSPRCPWSVASNAAWIDVAGETEREGSGVLHFEAAPNLALSQRSAELMIAGRKVEVRQAGFSDGPAPTAPNKLILRSRGSINHRVDMRWNDRSTDEVGFSITRTQMLPAARRALSMSKTQGDPVVLFVGSGTERFIDRGLQAGTEYCYVVRAYSENGFSFPVIRAHGCVVTAGARGEARSASIR